VQSPEDRPLITGQGRRNLTFSSGRLGTRPDDPAGPTERCQGFAQGTSGQQAAVTERFPGMDEEDVRIAVKASMLKAIVEKQNVRSETVHSLPSRQKSFRTG
jgi:hypothetical protein